MVNTSLKIPDGDRLRVRHLTHQKNFIKICQRLRDLSTKNVNSTLSRNGKKIRLKIPDPPHRDPDHQHNRLLLDTHPFL